MFRCFHLALLAGAMALPAITQAQMARSLPTQSLRGSITFGQAPEVTLNGHNARLAPGARIRDTQNMLALSASLTGQTVTANYTVDTYGLLMNVWILRPDEIAQNWPSNATEATRWSFDPLTSTWIKP